MSLNAVSTKEFSFWFGDHDLYWPEKPLISNLKVAKTKKGVIVNYSASAAGNTLIERSFTLTFASFDKVIELFEGIDSEKGLMKSMSTIEDFYFGENLPVDNYSPQFFNFDY